MGNEGAAARMADRRAKEKEANPVEKRPKSLEERLDQLLEKYGDSIDLDERLQSEFTDEELSRLGATLAESIVREGPDPAMLQGMWSDLQREMREYSTAYRKAIRELGEPPSPQYSVYDPKRITNISQITYWNSRFDYLMKEYRVEDSVYGIYTKRGEFYSISPGQGERVPHGLRRQDVVLMSERYGSNTARGQNSVRHEAFRGPTVAQDAFAARLDELLKKRRK